MLSGASTASADTPGQSLPAHYAAKPLEGVGLSTLQAQSALGGTVTFWSSKITSLGSSYTYSMVGNNPFVKESTPTTTVGVDLIPVKLTFSDTGHVFDPMATPSGCPSKTPVALTQGSPVFANHTYNVGGANVGTVQYTDAFQRENFAHEIFGSGAPNAGYNVNLALTTRPELNVSVPTGVGSSANYGGPCGWVGKIDLDTADNVVRFGLLPTLIASGKTNPSRLPILLVSNVLEDPGVLAPCCLAGYHSAVSIPVLGTQTYAVADYDTSGRLAGVSDIAPVSHEVGEWMDDPFGTNETPAWGNVGQVSGCQASLEVGDPLTGHSVPVVMPNGVTYHPQELAFFSWFYRQKPSIGLNGWYSSNHTFTTGAGGVCH